MLMTRTVLMLRAAPALQKIMRRRTRASYPWVRGSIMYKSHPSRTDRGQISIISFTAYTSYAELQIKKLTPPSQVPGSRSAGNTSEPVELRDIGWDFALHLSKISYPRCTRAETNIAWSSPGMGDEDNDWRRSMCAHQARCVTCASICRSPQGARV